MIYDFILKPTTFNKADFKDRTMSISLDKLMEVKTIPDDFFYRGVRNGLLLGVFLLLLNGEHLRLLGS